MKYFILLVFLSIGFLYAQDFRKITFGMSVSEVKKTESAALEYQDETILVYNVSVENCDMLLFYFFDDSKCYMAGYSYENDDTVNGKKFDLYEKWKSVVIKKYGQVKEKKDIDKNYIGYEDTALIIGKLRYSILYENDTTSITVVLKGGEYKSDVSIMFSNKKLFEKYCEKADSENEGNY